MIKSKVIFDAKNHLVNEPEQKQEVGDVVVQKQTAISNLNNLSYEANLLLNEYEKIFKRQRVGSAEPNIDVSQVLAPVAFLYERLRNAVDYKSEHLLKRNAIERILRRQIWERPGRDPSNLANFLVRELIWARYLKNDSIPKSKITDAAKILEKYLEIFHLLKYQTESGSRLTGSSEIRDWFFGVASCEVEEVIDPYIYYVDVLNKPVFLWFKKHFDWLDEDLSEEDKDIQILIAVHRSLPKSDNPRIRYHLLKTFYPEWIEVENGELHLKIDRIVSIHQKIEDHINSPIQPRIYRFVQKQAAAFQVLKEVIEEDIEKAGELLSNAKQLEDRVLKVCDRRYDEIRKKVNRGITRSVIYIFTTKVLLAFIIEVPYELIFVGALNYLSLLINTLFPPSLMFLLGLTIKRPGETNTKRIISKIKSFVYDNKDREKIRFSLTSSNRNTLTYRVFLSIYAFLFLLTFGVITYLLISLDYNLLSGIIFFVFLSLVLLFGYRVRFTASELNVTAEREGIISHLFSNLTLPFLNLGVWLTQVLARFNFLVVIMDFLIETPLKNIIAVFEEWTAFIREKREEVVEVPA